MPNTERLRATVAAVKADPNSFDMGAWFCGTTACFGGHAMRVKAQEEQTTLSLVKYDEDALRLYEPLRAESPTTARCRFGAGPDKYIPHEAAEYLELDDDQADRIFHAEEWPSQFEDEYERARAARNAAWMAQTLEDRVEHFIATGE